jgi:hypothetical protein
MKDLKKTLELERIHLIREIVSFYECINKDQAINVIADCSSKIIKNSYRNETGIPLNVLIEAREKIKKFYNDQKKEVFVSQLKDFLENYDNRLIPWETKSSKKGDLDYYSSTTHWEGK